MAQKSKNRFTNGAALLVAALLMVLFSGHSLMADDIDWDPAISLAHSSSSVGLSGGTENSNTWTFLNPTQNTATNNNISFLNNTGSTWTSLQIIATYSPVASHTFTCYTSNADLPAGSTPAFNSCGPIVQTATTQTFNYSGVPGIVNGEYLVFNWANWSTIGGSVLTSFQFTANGTSQLPSPVPEPSSILMLGSGAMSLLGLVRRKRS